MTSYALDELTWHEVGGLIARDARLILPVGALEQHGPHLPLGTNTFISERVAVEVADSVGVVRAPTFSYGATASAGPYSGVAGLRRKTVHRAVNELFARWEDQGVEEFIVVTAHRYEPHLEALLMALTAHSTTTVFDLYQIDVRDLLERDPEEEHAGELETSLMLHLAPERVRTELVRDSDPGERQLRRYMRGRVPIPRKGAAGTVGRPELATAEKGRRVFRRWVRTLVSALSRST